MPGNERGMEREQRLRVFVVLDDAPAVGTDRDLLGILLQNERLCELAQSDDNSRFQRGKLLDQERSAVLQFFRGWVSILRWSAFDAVQYVVIPLFEMCMVHARPQELSGASYKGPTRVVFFFSRAFSDEYTGGRDCTFSDYRVFPLQ